MVLRSFARTTDYLMVDMESNQETKAISLLYRSQRLVEQVARMGIVIRRVMLTMVVQKSLYSRYNNLDLLAHFSFPNKNSV